eukprot:TRINITY_DN8905_c0_g1_i2.p1 TRINITY_DN8905_c0_g1~~TRINITY_DN8905_c0_g1_i2.p1  ORF type:complete len:399 (-),score=23.80 TRINITY_DN8905_c0_g1_i2:409-1605(-)
MTIQVQFGSRSLDFRDTQEVSSADGVYQLVPDNDVFEHTSPRSPYAALRERLNSRGYLFLRNVISAEKVNRAYDRTKEHVDSEREKTGQIPNMEGWNELNHGKELLDVLEGEELFAFFQGLLYEGYADGGEQQTKEDNPTSPRRFLNRLDPPKATHGSDANAVRTFDYKWLRAVGPGSCTGAHMDAVYMSRGTDNLLTCWIPLQEIDLQLGGLAMLDYSNSDPAFERIRETYGRMDVETGVEIEGARRKYEGTGWLTTDPMDVCGLTSSAGEKTSHSQSNKPCWRTCPCFQPGDILVFTQHTLHMSLKNTTLDTLRISCDTRWQRADEGVDPRYVVGNVESKCEKPGASPNSPIQPSANVNDSEPEKWKFGPDILERKQDQESIGIAELREIWGIQTV